MEAIILQWEKAVKENNMTRMKELIDSNAFGETHQYFLYIAVQKDRIDVCKLLVSMCKFELNVQMHAYCQACARVNLPLVEYFESIGWRTTAAIPLYYFALHGHVKATEKYLALLDKNIYNQKMISNLIFNARNYGKHKIEKMLVEAWA